MENEILHECEKQPPLSLWQINLPQEISQAIALKSTQGSLETIRNLRLVNHSWHHLMTPNFKDLCVMQNVKFVSHLNSLIIGRPPLSVFFTDHILQLCCERYPTIRCIVLENCPLIKDISCISTLLLDSVGFKNCKNLKILPGQKTLENIASGTIENCPSLSKETCQTLEKINTIKLIMQRK